MLDRTTRILRKLTRLLHWPMDLKHHVAHPVQITAKQDIIQQQEFKVNELIRLADRERDSGDFAAAADIYIHILDLAPHRTDIRVQAANMLKDSGRLTEAEVFYRHAARETPNNGDVFLQLGHALKIAGRRAEAIDAYQSALQINPLLGDAERELFFLGLHDHQQRYSEQQEKNGIQERLLEIITAIRQSEDLLGQLKRNLPDLIGLSAFPINAYSLFRSYHSIPPPPQTTENVSFRISIICHVDASTVQAMEYQIRSALRQSNPLFSFYAIGTSPDLKNIVDRAAAADRRFFWVSSYDPIVEEQRIARQEDCDAVLLLPAGAELHQEAAAWIRHAFELYDAPAWITDEETLFQLGAAPARLLPVLRRIVDRETLLECNPYGEGIAIRRTKFISVSAGANRDLAAARHSLLLGLTSDSSVGHIPLPLIQNRLQATAKLAHPIRQSTTITIERRERIHIIIPTRDNLSDVEKFINSMKGLATNPKDLSFFIVNNRTTRPADLGQLEELTRTPGNHRLDVDEPFNWSRLNNLAASALRSGILVFANDDMIMVSQGWDGELLRLFSRPDVGIVGGKLLYPDKTIQHAGVLFGWKGSTIHDGIYESSDAEGPARRLITTRAVSAIDGAFLATPAALYHKVGGFDELHLPVCHSDVDYALRLRRLGLRVLWTPHVVLIHHEAKSRGLDHLEPEKEARAQAERDALRARWGRALDFDPSVHPYYLDVSRPFKLIRKPTAGAIARYMRVSASQSIWSDMDVSTDTDFGFFL